MNLTHEQLDIITTSLSRDMAAKAESLADAVAAALVRPGVTGMPMSAMRAIEFAEGRIKNLQQRVDELKALAALAEETRKQRIEMFNAKTNAPETRC